MLIKGASGLGLIFPMNLDDWKGIPSRKLAWSNCIQSLNHSPYSFRVD